MTDSSFLQKLSESTVEPLRIGLFSWFVPAHLPRTIENIFWIYLYGLYL